MDRRKVCLEIERRRPGALVATVRNFEGNAHRNVVAGGLQLIALLADGMQEGVHDQRAALLRGSQHRDTNRGNDAPDLHGIIVAPADMTASQPPVLPSIRTSSTRRFWARPWGVALSAIGRNSPYPAALSRDRIG